MDNKNDFVISIRDDGKPAIFRRSRIKSQKLRTDGYVDVEYDNGQALTVMATQEWPAEKRKKHD